MNDMKVFGSVAEMKAARKSLGNPGSLAEAITATGIDALFVLLDGGTVEIEGRKVKLGASLTSPETIEKVALLLHNRRPKCYESFGNEDEGCYCVSNAEAVLRSVEE